jgi:hypothetical protein
VLVLELGSHFESEFIVFNREFICVVKPMPGVVRIVLVVQGGVVYVGGGEVRGGERRPGALCRQQEAGRVCSHCLVNVPDNGIARQVAVAFTNLQGRVSYKAKNAGLFVHVIHCSALCLGACLGDSLYSCAQPHPSHLNCCS